MKVLIVCSATQNRIAPFILEQVDSVKALGVDVEYFTVSSKGIKGYLKHLPLLRSKISQFKPDLVHAHYGLSGLLANLQRKCPVVTTYHGSDINNFRSRIFSSISIFLSKRNIFVSNRLAKKTPLKGAYEVLSCGVDVELFKPLSRVEAREILGLDLKRKYILFSSGFDNRVKNYPLAAETIALLKDKYDVNLLEYKGYTRQKASLLFNAVDCVLVTSFKESGPLVIKEAMAVNTPAVSVDVGDVYEITKGVDGYHIGKANPMELSRLIEKSFEELNKINGREFILHLDINRVAQSLLEIYNFTKRK